MTTLDVVVWDCFPYWREAWAAQARQRLWERLAPDVDYRPVAFVGDRTHRGRPFDLPVVVPSGIWRVDVILDAPGGDTPAGDWGREEQQRDAVRTLLATMQPDDLILLADADELVDPTRLPAIVEATDRGPVKLAMANYTLGTKWRHRDPWIHPAACRAKHLPQRPTVQLRQWFEFPVVDHAGWHLSYQGTDADVDAKLSAFAHAELDTPQMRRILAAARAGRPRGFLVDALGGPLATILQEVTQSTPSTRR